MYGCIIVRPVGHVALHIQALIFTLYLLWWFFTRTAKFCLCSHVIFNRLVADVQQNQGRVAALYRRIGCHSNCCYYLLAILGTFSLLMFCSIIKIKLDGGGPRWVSPRPTLRCSPLCVACKPVYFRKLMKLQAYIELERPEGAPKGLRHTTIVRHRGGGRKFFRCPIMEPELQIFYNS